MINVAGKEQDIGPEWVSNDDPTDHSMPIADRIKQLRTEAGLSQAELVGCQPTFAGLRVRRTPE